jgi:enamine deaminase RidA (YjgF/YER057c/UK114 family)
MIRRIASDNPYEDVIGYSRAVVAGPFVIVSGCTATVDGRVRHEGDAYEQARTALRIALDAVENAGATAADVVRTRMYVVDMADSEAVGRAHAEVFREIRPAASMVQASGFIDSRMLVEIEVEAYREGM